MLPTFQNILYATDLSENARQALAYAASLAQKYQAQVTILHVVPDFFDDLSQTTGIDMLEEFGLAADAARNQEIAAGIRRKAENRLHQVHSEHEELAKNILNDKNIVIKTGSPVQTILQTAQEKNIDLIIMGTRGHSKLENLLLGSVAAGVIRRAACPVLVVHLEK